MISFEKKNILSVQADAIVNSVNLVGVMGKGVALSIKEAFPENYKKYKKACEEKKIDIGNIFVTETGYLFPKYIINFPTKKHWRYPSKYEWIEQGLISLVNWLKLNNVNSIVIPPLGSGNGKLDWEKVKPMILDYMKHFENDLNIIIIEPHQQPNKKENKTKSDPKLTPARAMLLYAMSKYKVLGYETNLLVVQKIAYFLQRLGEPLRLKFEKGFYGPFAYNLLPLLKVLKPKYINYKSLDSAKPSTSIKINNTRLIEVEGFVNNKMENQQKERMKILLALIKDFETPFGLELLGTIDYIFTQKNKPIDTSTIMSELRIWTERKEKLFKPYQVEVAKSRLLEFFTYEDAENNTKIYQHNKLKN